MVSVRTSRRVNSFCLWLYVGLCGSVHFAISEFKSRWHVGLRDVSSGAKWRLSLPCNTQKEAALVFFRCLCAAVLLGGPPHVESEVEMGRGASFSEFRCSMAALAASVEFRETGALLVACSDRPCAHLACGFHVGFGVGFLCWCWRWNFSMSVLQFLRSDAVLSFRSKFRKPTFDSLPCQHVSSRKV